MIGGTGFQPVVFGILPKKVFAGRDAGECRQDACAPVLDPKITRMKLAR